MRTASLETNIGVQLDRMLRTGACGTWWSATTATGYPLGVLQLDPELVSDTQAQERVAEAVAAVREVSSSGVLRTSELVVDRGRAWLVVAGPPAPTVADVLEAGTPLEPGSAISVAADVARALRDLHAVGLGHGDLRPDSVIRTPGGVALAEVCVLAAIRGTRTDVGRDSVAWAALARQLAELAPAAEAAALRSAAEAAEQGDLAAAVRRLSAQEPLVAGPASVPAAAGATVRLRFGPGVPAAAVGPAGRAPANRSGVPKPARPTRRPASVRTLQTAVVLLAVTLLAGAALWGFALLRLT